MPSAGQGTVAVQCRNSDLEMIDFLKNQPHWNEYKSKNWKRSS